MHEMLVIVPKKRSAAKKFLVVFFLVLACLFLMLAIVLATMGLASFAIIIAIVFIALWYWQAFRADVEWEYTYNDGEFRFAKIRAKRKRKAIAQVPMDEVIILAPKGDRGVYKYENDRMVTHKDLTSGGLTGDQVYEMVHKSEKGLVMYEFEPDADMLNAVRVKYQRIVAR